MPVSLSERTVRTLAQITAVLIEASARHRRSPEEKKTLSSLARVPSVKRHTGQDTGSRIKSLSAIYPRSCCQHKSHCHGNEPKVDRTIAAIGRRCYK